VGLLTSDPPGWADAGVLAAPVGARDRRDEGDGVVSAIVGAGPGEVIGVVGDGCARGSPVVGGDAAALGDSRVGRAVGVRDGRATRLQETRPAAHRTSPRIRRRSWMHTALRQWQGFAGPGGAGW